jgi:hypothetical protein
MTYQLHPLCTLFPRMSGAEFDALRDDIKANGLRSPIVLHSGMILDGGNRYRACVEAGVEPTFSEFDGGNLVSFVLSANLHRRNRSAGQQAAIVASATDWAKSHQRGGTGANQHKSKPEGPPVCSTVAERAALSGANERTQRDADKLVKEHPKLAKQVTQGVKSLYRAVQETKPAKAPAEAAPAETSDELAESRQAIVELAEEVEVLHAKLAVEQMEASEDDKTAAATLIAELRAQIKTLEAELKQMRLSRDTFQAEVRELQKQITMNKRELQKARAAA